MSSEDRRPDWEFWKYLTKLTILEAVTLSMDIDPKLINYRTHRLAYGEEVTKRDESPEFERRLALAIRNRTQLSRQDDDVSEMEDHGVDQPRFSIVALSWNWTLPPEMAALAEPDKRDAKILDLRRQVGALTQERDKLSAEVTDLTAKLQAADEIPSERSKKSYLNIIAVLLEYISGTVPTVGKHPSFKNEAQLIALIDSKFKGIPGLSERNLQGKFSEAKQYLDKT